MAMTATERQAKRRERIKSELGQGFSVMISFEEGQALDCLSRHYKMSKKDVISKLLLAEHERVLSTMMNDKDSLDLYMRRV